MRGTLSGEMAPGAMLACPRARLPAAAPLVGPIEAEAVADFSVQPKRGQEYKQNHGTLHVSQKRIVYVAAGAATARRVDGQRARWRRFECEMRRGTFRWGAGLDRRLGRNHGTLHVSQKRIVYVAAGAATASASIGPTSGAAAGWRRTRAGRGGRR
jgi:hypothetical protein